MDNINMWDLNNSRLFYKPLPMVLLLLFSGWILWGSFCAALFVFVSALAWINSAFLFAGLMIIALLVLTGAVFSLIMFISFLAGHEVIPFIKTRYLWLKYFTVVARSVAKRINLDTEKVIQTCIAVSNKFVIHEINNKENNRILILLPHCLQRHACGLKLTTNIHNCKKCGACSISSLINIAEDCKVDIFLATGGTLARQKILHSMPNIILAVACERDLLAGIRDTMPMKVIGVFNERPEGPCINTTINVDYIKNILMYLKPSTANI